MMSCRGLLTFATLEAPIHFRRLVLLSLVVLTPVPATGQDVALRAARLLDVETGEMIPDATIVVEDGRIAAVNPTFVPEGVAILDLGDATFLPGLIDVHVHLTAGCPTGDGDMTTSLMTICGVRNAKTTLLAGFTTVRNLGEQRRYPELVATSLSTASRLGWVDAPDVVPGAFVTPTGGHAAPRRGRAAGRLELGPEEGVADGMAEVISAVRHRIRQGARVIKVTATSGISSWHETLDVRQFSDEELGAIVGEAERQGVPVAVHAHGTDGIRAAVRAGVTSIEHGTLLDEVAIRMMVDRGTWLVPTGEAADKPPLDRLSPGARQKAEVMSQEAQTRHRRALDAGVRVAFGSDAPVIPHGENAREFQALLARGMRPLDAIRAATVDAAELLNLADRGRIARGLRADLIAVSGNPLDDPSVLQEVRFVMKAGTIHKRLKNTGQRR